MFGQQSPPESSGGAVQDSDFAFVSMLPRARAALGGALGTSLSPRIESPTGEHLRSMRGPAPRFEGQDLQGLFAIQKEQMDGYKRSIEHFILDRHYELERSLSRMLQDALGSVIDARVVTSSKGESKQKHSPDNQASTDILAQLDKMFKASEARAAHEYSHLTQKTIYGALSSVETVLETELNRLYDLIANSKDHFSSRTKSRLPTVNPKESTGGKDSTGGAIDELYPGTTENTTMVRFNPKVSNKEFDYEHAHLEKQKQQSNFGFPNEQAENSNNPGSGSMAGLAWVKKQVEKTQQVSHELGKAVGLHKAAKKTKDIFLRHPQETKNQCHGFVQKVVHSFLFFGVMEVFIVINVGIKAVQMDINVRRAARYEDDVRWGYYVDIVFTSIFSLEVVLRIIADHWYFFFGSQKAWNIFDLAVVTSSCIELLTDGLNIGFLRIFRSLRLVRVLKIVRVFRFFRELRLMAVSIASCMASLFWALIMMFVVVLVFAMFVLEGSKNFMRDANLSENEETRRIMDELFGSFPKAVYSLVQAISGGNDWGYFAEPLVEVSWVYAVGFSLFISFVTLGMMNILIGIFVENAQQYSSLDRDLVIQEEMHQRKSYMNQLRELFNEMDQDKSGTVTYQEFNDCLSHERARAYLDFLQLSASEAQGLFMLLDLDQNGEVGVEEFVLGCMRLKGTAKSIDAASMMFQTKRLAVKLNEFFEYTRQQFELLNKLDSSQSVEAQSMERAGTIKREGSEESSC